MTDHLGAALGALVVFLFVVALATFVDGVNAVGACGVGPAAPTTHACKEIAR